MAGPGAPLPPKRALLVTLVFLAALLPEGITGSTPLVNWGNPILVVLNLWLYGSGVLVCREIAVRRRAGWPGIALLGAAYGIVEEGLTLNTMFDPNSPVVGALGWYGRWGGVNWVWAVWLTTFHAAFSIAFPIFLVEWRWPSLRGRTLLSRRQLLVALGLLAGVAVFGQALLTPYRPGPVVLGGAVAVVLVLAWAAGGWAGRRWARFPSGRLPRPRVYAAAGFAFFGLSFLASAIGPGAGEPPLFAFLEAGGLVLAALLLLRRASGRPDAEAQRFAFVAGSIGFFGTLAVIFEIAGRFGTSLFGIGFIALVVWLYRHGGRIPAPLGAPPPAAVGPMGPPPA